MSACMPRRAASCSALALATALAAAPAYGQTASPSFNAVSVTLGSGSVNFDRGMTTPGTDVYTVNSPTAVIDFVPSDTATGGGAINFQNVGTTAIFQSSPGGPNFTVLNRIVPVDPSRPIAFNGNVVSNLRNAAGASARGGSVWFYSPGGIVIGDGAVFDIGNLLLSTGDPTGGSGTISSPNQFTLSSNPNDAGIVNILSNATINAANAGSYVALVAPTVFQAGRVNINGSAAYVAAEQATLTFSQGLFNISVQVGSSASSGVPLQHRGTTRFTNVATPSRAYLVAVPKNDAITLVVGGTADIGFDIATAANVENGILVLSAGYRSLSDTTATTDNFFLNPATQRADLFFEGGGTFNAAVVAGARDEARITVNADTLFTSDVELRGGVLAHVGGDGAGNQLTIGGDLTLRSDAPGVNSSAPTLGGQALLAAFNGGATQIGGTALVQAQANGISSVAGATGTATGGDATINALGGDVTIGGNATISTTGFSATTATGGSSNVFVTAGRTLAVGGSLNVSATGVGFADNATIGTASGGAGIGGTARISPGGTLTVGGSVFVSAGGSGGAKTLAGAGAGGAGTGGSASIAVQPGASVTIGGAVNISATGGGGAGSATGAGGGAATAGNAFINVGAAGQTALLDVTGAVSLTAAATGGAGSGAPGAQATSGIADLRVFGGTARLRSNVALNTGVTSGAGSFGGAVVVTPNVGSAMTAEGGALTIGGSVTISANATGGASATAATGVDATGNLAVLEARGGAITISGSATVSAGGVGGQANGATATGGAGRGGQALAIARTGGTLTAGSLSVTTPGTGGAGGATGTGGAGVGGASSLSVDAGTVSTTGNLNVAAIGTGGGGLNGGAGRAGTAQLLSGAGGGSISAGSTNVDAGGIGTISITGTGAGQGGAGIGGAATIQLAATSGTATTIADLGQLTVQTGGFGAAGQTGAGAAGGSGVGGTAVVQTGARTTLNAGAALIRGDGQGAAGSGAAAGGAGTAGSTRVLSLGTANFASLQLFANALGGSAAGSGAGGVAQGGASSVQADAGGRLTVAGATSLNSGANGGNSVAGAGSAATGADARMTATNGGTVTAAAVSINASAIGGGGTIGGTGTASTASISQGTGGTVQVATATIAANGTGGASSAGVGGVGRGGDIRFVSNDGTIRATGAVNLVAAGAGGASSAAGSAGGAGIGGLANIGSDAQLTQIDDTATLTVNGTGGSGGLVAAGGAGTGGQAIIGTIAAGRTSIAGAVTINAIGQGGSGTNGGVGTGGTPSVFSTVGRTDLGAVTIQLRGLGGAGFGGSGGNGVGGVANVTANGMTTINGNLNVNAGATGGAKQANASNPTLTGNAGSAVGGRAIATANAGALRINGSATLNGGASGGSVPLTGGGVGNGGDARATEARLSTFQVGASTIVTGDVTITADTIGGNGSGPGSVGGSAFGGVPSDLDTGPFNQGAYLVANGGPVTIGGNVVMRSAAVGGNGASGGRGVGGLIQVIAAGSNIVTNAASTFIADASGIGGNAVSAATYGGGAGGAGDVFGGITISSNSGGGQTPVGTPSSITLGAVTLSAASVGGIGGNGLAGQAGGRGGDAEAGGISVIAQAGSGRLTVASLQENMTATGGNGGAGGAVSTGAGGAGGAGGSAFGGGGNTGTASGADTTTNNGRATFGNVVIQSNATGGAGGAGGSGTTQGVGGAGGDATGGGGVPLARGTPVTMANVTIAASGTGGAGGAGGTRGAGGAGTGGVPGIVISNRFMRTERGSFTAGNVSITANGTGGAGGTTGLGTAGVIALSVMGADATIAGATLTANGAAPPPATAGTTGLTVSGGTLAVPSFFSANVTGNIAVLVAPNGLLALSDAFLQATGSLVLTNGTITTDFDSIDIASNLGIFTGNDLTIDQDIEIAGDLSLSSGGNLTTANITAGSFIDLSAGEGTDTPRNLRTGALTVTDTGTFEESGVTINASGTVEIASITGGYVDIDPDDEDEGGGPLPPEGDLTVGRIIAVDSVNIIRRGRVTLGDITLTRSADFDPEDTEELPGVLVDAVGDVRVGAITSPFLIGLASRQGGVTAGNLTGEGSIALFAATSVTTGALVGGRGPRDTIFVSNAGIVATDPAFQTGEDEEDEDDQPFFYGGEDDDEEDAFQIDYAAITPVRLGGALTINGRVFTSNFLVAANSFTSGAIDATTRIAIDSGTTIAAGDITTPASLALTSDGNVTTGVVNAASIALTSRNGAIGAGALTATGSVALDAAGAVSAGAVGGSSIALTSRNGAVTSGALTAGTTVALDAAGAVTTTTVNAGSIALTSRTAAVASGALTAAATVAVNAAGAVTTGAISSGTTTAIVAGGAATIGSVVASRLTLDARGLISIGAVTTSGDTLLTATGNRIAASGPIAAGGSIALLADTGFTTGALTASRGAGGFVYLAAASNRSRIADGALTAAFAAGDATAATAPVAIGGAISTGLLRVASTGANSYAAIDAAQSIRILAGTATFNGAAAAPTIDLSSTDIALAQGITFGGAATQSLTLTARATAPVLIGGAATDQPQGAYLLDAAEAARLRAANIAFTQQGSFSGDAQMVLRDLTLTGSGAGTSANLTSSTGALTLTSPGSIRVTGNVRLNNMATGNALVVNAGEDFDLVTDTGSLGLFGTGEALGGRLAINTVGGITVANARLFALGDATDFDDADPATVIAMVGASSGQNRPEGFLQANRLELSAREFIVVQNSGTATTAGGFTAGPGGMRVTSTETQTTGGGVTGSGTAVIVYGRVQREDGSFVTNNDTRGAITFVSQRSETNPLAGFAPFSVVNGCTLAASSACGGSILPPAQQEAVVTIGTDVQGVVDGALSAEADGESVGSIPDVRLQTVIDQAALTTDSIINEPVASGGNASLWEAGEGTASEDEDDDQRRRRTPAAATEGKP